MTILTFTTGLTCILGFLINKFGDSFFVCNLRFTNVCFYFEFAEKTVNDDFEVKLTHTSDDGLSGFFIGISSEGGVLFSKFCKGDSHFFLTSFGFRFDCKADNRFREFHLLEFDRMFRIAKGITGGGVFKAYCCCDIAAIAAIEVFSVVCMHLKNTAESFVLVFGRVENSGTCFNFTGVNSEEAEFTNERVCSNFECKDGERFIVSSFTFSFFTGLEIGTFYRRDIERRGHVIYDCVKKFLYAFVTVGSTAAYRNEGVIDGTFSDCSFDLINGEFFALKVFFHEAFISFNSAFDKFFSVFFAEFNHVFGDISYADIFAEVIVEDISFHLDKVYKAFEECFSADRHLNYERSSFKSGFDHVNDMKEVRTEDIHFVNVNHTGDSVFVCLTPYGFRLGFYAAFCAENGYGTVEHAERSFNLNSKVYVSGSIDDVDTMVVPVSGGCSRSDGDTSLLFLNHPVHGSATIVGFTDFIVNTGIVKDTFGCGSLSCVDVSHDTDISGHLK